MLYVQLGDTPVKVSKICLGTMTWGEQNSEAEAHQQLDFAFERGVNFVDTAEMYPVPPQSGTYGDTEKIIGSWLRRRGRRDKVILATKVLSRSNDLDYVRDGDNRLNRANIEAAVNASLSRLQTDYIDLYQLHWPDRRTNCFGQLGYRHDDLDNPIPIEETLRVLADVAASGKIRYIGLSNETPWGVMKYLELADKLGLPRVVSIQNPYNLLNRSFEIGLAEIAHRERVGLLAYSPLGFGVLSGKYLHGKKPSGARLTHYSRFRRYTNDIAQLATAKYTALAQNYGIDPAKMALAYCNSRPFLTSTIIGATGLTQLRSNIDSIDIDLPDALLQDIDQIHHQHPNPCP